MSNRRSTQKRPPEAVVHTPVTPLSANEMLLANLLESAPGAIVVIDQAGIIQMVNRRTEAMFGYVRTDLIGQPVEMLLPEALRSAHQHHRSAYFATPEHRPMGAGRDLLGRRGDGTEFPVEIGLSFLPNEHQTFGIAFIADITERKKTEAALANSEERFRFVFERATIGHSLTLPTGRFLQVNQAFADMVGYTVDEMLQVDFPAISHPAEVELTREIMRSLTNKEQQTARFEKRYIHKDGHEVWAEVSTILIRDQDDAPLYFLTSINDITERKKAEAALKESEARFFTFFHLSPVATVVTRVSDQRFVDFNRSFLQLCGFTREEAIGHSSLELNLFAAPAVRQQLADNFREQGSSSEREIQLRTKSGAIHDVIISSDMVVLGGEQHIITMCVDITGRKQIERDLQASKERLQSTLDHMMEGCQIISHDWRYLYLNDTAIGQSHKTREELIGNTMMEMYPGIDQTPLFDVMRRCMETHVSEHMINEFTYPDGGKGWYSLSIQPVAEGLFILSSDITEVKRAEETMRYHADLLNQLADAVISTDLNFNIRSWNDAAERIYGYSATEAIGQSMGNLIPTNYVSGTSLDVFNSFTNDGKWNGEVIQTRKDGTVVPILSSVIRVRDQAGDPTGVVAVNRDITERKEAEASEREQRQLADALREVAATLTGTLDLNTVLNGILDAVGRVLPHDANSIMLVQNGIATIVSHRGFVERGIVPAATELVYAVTNMPTLRHMAQTGRSLVIPDTRDFEGWIGSHATAWIRSTVAAPIRVGSEILGFINLDSATPGFFTEEQAARLQAFADHAAVAVKNAQLYHELETYSEILEQAVHERTEELQATMHRVETILNSVGDALLVLSRDGIIQQVNPAFYTQTGFTEREAQGQNHHDLLKLKFGSKGDYYAALETLQPGELWSGQTKVLRKDASSYDADLTIAPVLDDSGSISLLVAVIRDITPLKEVERAKDEFVSNVSHELRTPITGIKLNHSMLARNPERREVYMERIGRDIDRLNELIESLLRLTRLEQGRVELELTPVDLNKVGAQLVNDRQPIAETRSLALTFEGTSDLGTVTADESLVGQALSVLLTNALNYTPAGGRVIIKTSQEAAWVGISVVDSGPGISPAEQPRLFERFYRGSVGRASRAPGTGLGLNIARQIVERHNGKLELFSEGIPGKGASFTIWLPTDQPE